MYRRFATLPTFSDQRSSGILPKGVTVACRNSLGSSSSSSPSSRILQERLLVVAKAQ